MKDFRSELFDLELRFLLRHVLGTHRPLSMLGVVLTLAFLGWFADSLYGTSEALLRRWAGEPLPAGFPSSLVLALPLILVLGILAKHSQRARARLDFRVVASRESHDVRALIVFLSNPWPDDLDTFPSLTGRLADPALRARATGRWRMPLEAIAFHAFAPSSRLREIVVVASSGPKGSQDHLDTFIDTFDRLWPPNTRPVRLRSLGDLDQRWTDGLDAFNVEDAVQAVDEVFRRLGEEGIRRDHIVVDITGGPKPLSAAGVAVALAEGRRFQYVDTHSYGVTVYDPTYDPTEDDP